MKFVKIIFFITLIPTCLLAKTDFFDQGLILYKKNNLEKAKFKFEQDLVFNPKNEKSYLYLSKIFNLQNKKRDHVFLNIFILLDLTVL